MSPEKQRIAIAEACGWERWVNSGAKVKYPKLTKPRDAKQRQYWLENSAVITTEPVAIIDEDVPDYPHDLNAMHVAEKTLTFNQAGEYERRLAAILLASVKNGECPPLSYHSTAAQRAEAFLRTLNKWEDS